MKRKLFRNNGGDLRQFEVSKTTNCLNKYRNNIYIYEWDASYICIYIYTYMMRLDWQARLSLLAAPTGVAL